MSKKKTPKPEPVIPVDEDGVPLGNAHPDDFERATLVLKDATEDAPAAPVSSTTARELHANWRSPKNAAKKMRLAVQRLERFAWDELGQPGVRGALAILRSAASALATMPKRASRTIVAGSAVRVRDKARPTYEGLYAVADLSTLVVLAVVKGSAACKTVAGERIRFPLQHLELETVAQDESDPEPIYAGSFCEAADNEGARRAGGDEP